MKFWTKKRAAALGLAAVMTLSLTACGEKTPSLEEVEQAIEAGTLTVEDALDKGWVDQAWADAYWEESSVPAVSKIEANRVGEFTTTTLSGEPFTREDLGDVLLFAFVDPASEEAGAFYDASSGAGHRGSVLYRRREPGGPRQDLKLQRGFQDRGSLWPYPGEGRRRGRAYFCGSRSGEPAAVPEGVPGPDGPEAGAL